MKNVLLILVIVIACLSCKKDDPTPVKENPSIVGQTYSGYSTTSIFDGVKLYRGYKFISKSRCLDLLLEENSRIISSKEVGYTLNYPNITIEDTNAKDGHLKGVFDVSGNLTIAGVIMKKW